jgi:hypothetical protein
MNSSNNNSVYNNPSSLSSSSSLVNIEDSGMFSNKNGIIIFLLVLVILSFLGINMLIISGNVLEELSKIFGPTVKHVASMLGYSTGELVETTADVGADAAKLGIDIAEGSAQSVAKLLKNASESGLNEAQRKNLKLSISSPKQNRDDKSPEPSQSADSIHRSISSKKGGWCFIGEDAGSRGCVSIDEHDKCMSGQIFPSKESCVRTP